MLSKVPQVDDPRVLVGNNNSDDAGVFQISPDRALVHTVDLLAPVVDDPYTFGRIAAVNSLSDIYAMGGKPLSAMNVIGFPGSLDAEIIGEILHGGQDEVINSGAAMMGGHTFQNAEIMYGLALTGIISPHEIYTNSNARHGDLLILTKCLGIGTLIQAMMTRGVIPASLRKQLVESMTSSNRIASELMCKFEVHACTDITGFGFLGHCSEMAEASGVGIAIRSSELPLFPKVLDLIGDGITDAGVRMNRNSFEDIIRIDENVPPAYGNLLYGSETSGGLLIAIEEKKAGDFVRSLHDKGVEAAAIVGEVTADEPGMIKVHR